MDDISTAVVRRTPAASERGNAFHCAVAWEALLEYGTSGHVYLHPHLVLSGLTAYTDSRIVTISESQGEREDCRAVAVLVPKIWQTRVPPGPWRRFQLAGLRLVGDQILTSDPNTLYPMVRNCADLLDDQGVDCLYFEIVKVGSALWQAVHQIADERRSRVGVYYPWAIQPHHVITFPDPPNDYWKQFSSKSRSTLRRKAKKLDHQLLKFTTPEQVPSFLALAQQVSRKSWQTARLGLRVTTSEQSLAYWTRIAEVGAFRSYVLQHGEMPVAFVIGTCLNGCYTYEELAYDPGFASFSPGTVLLYRILEEMIEKETPRLLDFGFGDAEYKRMFANTHDESGPILLVRRSLRNMWAMNLDRCADRLARLSRSTVRRLGMEEFLRRRARRGQ